MMPPRRWILAIPAALLRADERGELTEWFGELAARLADGNPGDFLRAFARDMPRREELDRNVHALVRAFEVSSSLNLLRMETGRDGGRVEVDWYLELRSLMPSVPNQQRRRTLQFRIERFRKSWRALALDAVDFFAPP